VISLLEAHGLTFKVIDIARKDDIADKDLDFLLQNQHVFFRTKGGPPGRSYSRRGLRESMYDFRKAIDEGERYGNFPFVICDGRMELYFNDEQGWVRSGNLETSQIWQTLRK